MNTLPMTSGQNRTKVDKKLQ